MKKIFSFLAISFLFIAFIKAQTVDSIRIEQAGDLIKIHYKILNSTDKQIFRVTVTCSINGGLQSIPKSLSGDFGENVVGGRNEYMVLWDVLKDMDEVKSVDFAVKAELMKDYSVEEISGGRSASKKRLHAFLAVGGPGPVFGAKIGYMESWGITALCVVGGKMDGDDPFDATPAPSHFAASINLTKRIINAKKFKFHLTAGAIATKYGIYPDGSSSDPTEYKTLPGIEVGLITSIQNFSLSFGVAGRGRYLAGGGQISDDMVGNFGIGWRF